MHVCEVYLHVCGVYLHVCGVYLHVCLHVCGVYLHVRMLSIFACVYYVVVVDLQYNLCYHTCICCPKSVDYRGTAVCCTQPLTHTPMLGVTHFSMFSARPRNGTSSNAIGRTPLQASGEYHVPKPTVVKMRSTDSNDSAGPFPLLESSHDETTTPSEYPVPKPRKNLHSQSNTELESKPSPVDAGQY